MIHLTIATRNPHKAREFAAILGPRFAVSDLTYAANVPEVEETGTTFEENAILKAVAASRAVPGLVVADDSGLEVSALGGAPGVYSARYAGEHVGDLENVIKLLKELEAAPAVPDKRKAQFCCAIALARDGKTLTVFHGALKGIITAAPRGVHGFGYDPIFAPRGYDLTFAELDPTVKNRISHRALVIARLREHLLHPH